ncbi:unnamed protein product [Blepharisma stoltei]|uniref:Uncharacterized protein n=1 Tax=Blepharisma stoltei TaxID=1481888 RepID=A0AAU9JYI3_9CILI|nr:unnamed protein product [Blepharisma stoltei]
MSTTNSNELSIDKSNERPKTVGIHLNTQQSAAPRSAFSKSLMAGLPSSRSLVRVPSREEINQITGTFVSSKKRSTETNFYSTFSSESQRLYKLPRLALIKALKGLNTGSNWFNDNEDLNLLDTRGSTRFSAKPGTAGQTWNNIFPTRSVPFQKFPETHSERFSLINPRQDSELANYVVNSTNAFRTEWSKRRELKDRKFFPELHPEFVGFSKEHGLKRDRIVIYREEMMKVKNMMNEAWTKKKGPGAKV